jgi:SAM-dependent methyltransferase
VIGRFELPPRGALARGGESDPLPFYYRPVIGRLFAARIDLALGLLDRRFDRLLEVGYGSGLLVPTLARLADRVDGIDLNTDPAATREALSRIGVEVGSLERADVRQMPFDDVSFDIVVAISIFEHLRTDELDEAAREVVRVLRPDGVVLIGCPAVHRTMNVAFAAIGFGHIAEHHFSDIHAVTAAFAAHGLGVRRSACLPRFLPRGLAPYCAVLLGRGAGSGD